VARVPERLTVGPYRYAVEVSTDGIDAEAVASRAGVPGTYAGRHLPVAGRVLLADGMGADYAAETLLHEVLHACLFAVGDPLDDGQLEERLCSTLAPTLLAALRSPGLAEFLLDPEPT
jgi:hypothetical protein